MKVKSGSPRDKTEPTPKQNKWKDPFYAMEKMVNKKWTDIWPVLQSKRGY